MSDFTSTGPTSSVPDPSKRVRYSTGLVLGVDEFEQEQAYFVERDRLLTRALHGYGVVQGLRVHVVDAADTTPQVQVQPGLAIEPSGQHVCVDQAQCAIVDDWLAQQTAGNLIGDAPEPMQLCLSVVLRYGTCATDFVPLPGEPCRSAEESRTASRLADDFSLTLEPDATAPPQVEEHAIRLFGRLLRAVVVHPSGPHVSDATLTRLVRALPKVDDLLGATLEDLAAATGTSDTDSVSLPTTEEGEPIFRIEPGRKAAVLRVIEEAWVTHARPVLLRRGHGDDPLNADGTDDCQPVPASDDGIILGTLCFEIESGGSGGVTRTTPDDGLTATDEDRPLLLASRVLQEARSGVFDRVRPGTGDGEDDTLAGSPAGGDLTGTYPDPEVAGLRGEGVSMDPADADLSLSDGHVLTYDGSTWRPEPVPSPEPPPDPEPVPTNAEPGLTRLVALSWSHGEVQNPQNLTVNIDVADAEAQDVLGLAVAFGVEPLAPRLEESDDGLELTIGGPGTVQGPSLTNNTFRVFTETSSNGMGLSSRFSVEPQVVLPLVDVALNASGRGTSGFIDPDSRGARGALFVIGRERIEVLLNREVQHLDVLIRGDAILDVEGRAIDAEFVRSALPTGDRPAAATAGVQGGRFESWFSLVESESPSAAEFISSRFGVEPSPEVEVVRLNEASVDQLTRLPNVGEVIAERIRAFIEERGGIDSPLVLADVQGLTEERIREWEGRVEPPLPS